MVEKEKPFGFFKDIQSNLNKQIGYIKYQINESKQSEDEYKDHCTIYKFDLKGDKIDFNDRFNDGYMAEYLEVDFTSDLLEDIEYIIEIDSNIIFMVFGPRNMAKSEVIQFIAMYYRSKFEELDKTIKVHMCFDDNKLEKIFGEMHLGDFGIRDESPKGKGPLSNAVKDHLYNVCNITRGFQVSFGFCNPQPLKATGVDYYLEVAGKLIAYKCVECGEIVFNLEKKQRKICSNCGSKVKIDLENCSNRCLVYNRKFELIGCAYFPLHGDTEFREEYRKLKHANIIRTLKRRNTSSLDGEKIMKMSAMLADWCKVALVHRKKITLNAIKTQIPIINETLDDDDKILGIGEEIKAIVENALNIIKNPDFFKKKIPKKTEDEGEKVLSNEIIDASKKVREIHASKDIFKPFEELVKEKIETFGDFCRLRIIDEATAKVAEALVKGISMRSLHMEDEHLNDYKVYPIAKKFKANEKYHDLGDLFVEYCALCKLHIPPEEIEECIQRRGQRGVDIFYKDVIYTVKYEDHKGKLKYYQDKDFRPEYTKALELEHEIYYLLLYNPQWNRYDKIMKQPIFPHGSMEVNIAKPYVKHLDMGLAKVFNTYELI